MSFGGRQQYLDAVHDCLMRSISLLSSENLYVTFDHHKVVAIHHAQGRWC